jgi:cytochrome d ubiquinol oxidase subunit I
MVGLGFWFILLAFWGGYRWYKDQLLEDELLHKALMGSSLLGIAAVELGWIVTEVGRQPWVIQGVMRTSEGVSPGLTGTEATITLVGFVGVYATLLGLYAYVVWRIIRNGPPDGDELQIDHEKPQTTGPERPVPGVGDDD